VYTLYTLAGYGFETRDLSDITLTFKNRASYI
jgi:hypothetical protein